jgi:hypothetical protein
LEYLVNDLPNYFDSAYQLLYHIQVAEIWFKQLQHKFNCESDDESDLGDFHVEVWSKYLYRLLTRVTSYLVENKELCFENIIGKKTTNTLSTSPSSLNLGNFKIRIFAKTITL